MLVFLDTEFTDRTEPYLISIGMVAGDRVFYAELAGVSDLICSPFVRDTVLPLLERSGLQPGQVASRIVTFLELFGGRVTFFCEDPRYDVELLRPFLPAQLKWSVAVPSFDSDADERAFEAARQRAFASGLRRHHALDDARALALAWSSLKIGHHEG